MDFVLQAGTNYTFDTPNRQIRYIVVHDSATGTSKAGTAKDVARLFAGSDRPVSADFIVDDEIVVQYTPDPLNYSCWHCDAVRSDSHGGSLFGVCTNANAMGVVICSANRTGKSTFANDPNYYFTDAVLDRAAKLIGYLMDTYHIDVSHIVRHYDATGTICPGIIGWNEESGSAEHWYAFRKNCQKHSRLANRGSGCTISGSDILRVLRENGIVCKEDARFSQTVFSFLAGHSDDASSGSLFFCKGAHFRPEYLSAAAKRGAAAYVSEQEMDTELPGIVVSDVRTALGLIAKAFYGDPQKSLTTIGVTGTNGKTTVSGFISNILEQACGKRPGLLSTVGAYDGQMERELSLTTPESDVTYSFLHETKRNGGTHFVMECSSQSEKMKRLTGLSYDIGVFTNISDDHYSPQEHRSFEEYFGCKLEIIRRYQNAVINADDPHCTDALQAAAHAGRVVTYSLSPEVGADVYAETIHARGLRSVFTAVTPEWKQRITVPFPGDFNISNALAACAVGYLLGLSPEKIAAGIEKTFIHGRMFVFDQYGYSVIVDYAHNYAAIRAALETAHALYPKKNIQLLFGCTGTTGLQRRKDIVRAAAPFCEKFYLTTDDPYDADPNEIIREIRGYARQKNKNCVCIPDRTECVETALESMKKTDLLFIAAKGAENYIKCGTKRLYYESDPAIVWRVLYRKMEYRLDRNLFYTWRTYDEVYNAEEAWPAEEYPDAPGTRMRDNGSYIVSLAILLRHFGMVTEPLFEKFNPWVLWEKLKSIHAFAPDGSVNAERLSEILPIRFVDSVPYDRQTLVRSLEEGYACQLLVSSRIADPYYVVPYKVTEDDVEIVDCVWDAPCLSLLEPQRIVRYLPTEAIKLFRISDQNSTWYWYHQNKINDITAYEAYHPIYGRFGQILCGNNVDFLGDLLNDGCTIWNLAIALSNVMDRAVTPFHVLLDVLKAPIFKQEGQWAAYIDGSHGIDMIHQPYPIVLPERLCEAVQSALPDCHAVHLADFHHSQAEVDKTLRAGGCVYVCVEPCTLYTGSNTHMIVLREKKADGKYYVLTSAALNTFGNTEEGMIRAMFQIGMDWDALCKSVCPRHCCIAFTRKEYPDLPRSN